MIVVLDEMTVTTPYAEDDFFHRMWEFVWQQGLATAYLGY